MAKKEEIVFDAKIDTSGNGAKSLSQLKKEFKELQTQLSNTKVGTEEYSKTLQQLGAVKDDIGDLRDTINALNPEGKIGAFSNIAQKLAGGFQAASGAAALFGKSGEDVQKVLLKVQAATAFAEGLKSLTGLTDGFKILGQVIKANPILLIASVLISIGVAAYALKDKIAFLGKAFEAAGKAISFVVQLGKDFLDQTGLTSFAMDDLADKMDKYSKVAMQGAELRQKAYKREIDLLKAQGKETYNLEREALKAKLNADASRMDSLAKQRAIGKKFSEDEQKEYDELVQKVLDTNNEILSLDAAFRVEQSKKAEEARKKAEEEAKKKAEHEKKLTEESIKEFEQAVEEQDKINQEATEKRQHAKDVEEEYYRKKEDEAFKEGIQMQKERLEQEKQLERELAAAKLQIQDQSLNAAKGLSDAFFAFQLNKVQKGSEEELKIKKRQFEIDKALSIARATIDGIRSVQAALTVPPPAGQILAGLNAALAAANIAKIAATQFDGGGAGSSAPSVSTGGGQGGGSTPQINSTAPNYQSLTTLNSQGGVTGKEVVVKAEVVETQATSTQKRVARLKKQASFP